LASTLRDALPAVEVRTAPWRAAQFSSFAAISFSLAAAFSAAFSFVLAFARFRFLFARRA
jgi:hypothetical protein